MSLDEVFEKLLQQYQKGLISMEDFHAELIEQGLKNRLGINEGIAR